MAALMNLEPEYTRQEGFIAYTAMLKERFESGMLSELRYLNQCVVWRAELEEGKPKEVPYNPTYYHLQARASVKIPKSWGALLKMAEHLGIHRLSVNSLYNRLSLCTDAGIIGGIGVSGGHYTHDMEVAQAGLAAL